MAALVPKSGAIKLALLRRALRSTHIRRDPSVEEVGDFQVILLEHHHVAIPVNAVVRQLEQVCVYTRLIEPKSGTVIKNGMKRGLADHDDSRYLR